MATNLSKDWTLERALGTLRRLTNKISTDEYQDADLVDFLHLAICDVAELLNSAAFPDYGVKVTVTQTSNVISIATYRIDSISKLVDSTNGLCIEQTPKEFEQSRPQEDDNVYWYQFGESIYLKKGGNISTYGTLTLFYNRVPIKVIEDSDTLDIKDKFVKLVIDKAKLYIYESENKTPPEALTGAVNNAVQQIRDSNIKELGVVKS